MRFIRASMSSLPHLYLRSPHPVPARLVVQDCCPAGSDGSCYFGQPLCPFIERDCVSLLLAFGSPIFFFRTIMVSPESHDLHSKAVNVFEDPKRIGPFQFELMNIWILSISHDPQCENGMEYWTVGFKSEWSLPLDQLCYRRQRLVGVCVVLIVYLSTSGSKRTKAPINQMLWRLGVCYVFARSL